MDDGRIGPIHSLTGVFMSTVCLLTGAHVDLPAPLGRSVLPYVVRGALSVSGVAIEPWRLVTLNDDGEGCR
jgi:hypothetical protein